MRHTIRWKRRLKRWVAPGLRLLGAARDVATAGKRPDGLVTGHNPGGELRSTAHELIALAWPIAAAMFGETALGLVTTKLMGGLGAAALGGVGIATTLMYLSYSVAFGLGRGVKVRAAYAVGGGRPEDGVRYAWAGAVLGVGLGALVWALGRDVGWLLRGIGIDGELVGPAREFLRAVTWGSPATCTLAALINYKQGVGDSRTPMIVGIGGNVVNAVLSYGLIYGHFGLPALGVKGGGYGTATSEWLEASVMIALLARDGRRAARESTLRLSRALAEVADLGVPTGLQFGAEMLAFSTFAAIIGSLGDTQMAAHQIALTVIRTSFLPGIAVGEAASVLVGRSLARRKLREADRVTIVALAVAIGFMAACGVVFGLFGGAIAHAFSTEAEVTTVATRLLLVAAAFQILDAINIVLRGALRGAKDVKVAAALGIVIVWTCQPTAAYLLGKVAGWGVVGGWLGFIAETILASWLFWRRWSRGAWRAMHRGEHSPESTPDLLAA